MPVTFNENDYALDDIRKESKLGSLKTRAPFRVYGLKRADGKNPPVRVDVGAGIETLPLRPLAQFFTRNDMMVVCTPDPRDRKSPKVRIGLRRDLRKHPVLCACIVQTIVYYLEGKLKLRDSFRITGIPKM